MPKLDQVPFKDPRSRNYPMRALMQQPINRTNKIWAYPAQFPLDQGQEGACVGFGWCGELGAAPVMYNTTNSYAFDYYKRAREEDAAMGNVWDEGASVLAGAKVAQRFGMIGSYHWGFSINDTIDAVISKGPVVWGINWYESMYETQPGGLIQVNGEIAGGHCILVVGYVRHKVYGECLVLLNSWGLAWGDKGLGYLPISQGARLLAEGGESCIATDIRR